MSFDSIIAYITLSLLYQITNFHSICSCSCHALLQHMLQHLSVCTELAARHPNVPIVMLTQSLYTFHFSLYQPHPQQVLPATIELKSQYLKTICLSLLPYDMEYGDPYLSASQFFPYTLLFLNVETFWDRSIILRQISQQSPSPIPSGDTFTCSQLSSRDMNKLGA